MSSAFDRLANAFGLSSRASQRPRRVRRQVLRNFTQVEHLEDRHLMSVVPVGTETLVHAPIATTQVTWEQSPQAVAMIEDGRAVITFGSPNTGAESSGASGVWVRRVPANGSATVPIEVNFTKTGDQAFGSVAMAPDGSFIVTWSGNGVNSGGRTTDLPAQGAVDGSGIFFRRFNAAGVPIDAGERMVNTTLPTGVGADAIQEHPSIAIDGDGRFVIVWTVREGSGTLNAQRNVYMRRYAETGLPIDTTEVQVNTSATQVERLATVATNASGNIIIAWSAAADINANRSVLGRYISTFTAAPANFGPVFNVSAGSTPFNQYVSLGMDNAGDFVATYTLGAVINEDPTNLTGDGEILFRRFTRPVGAAAAPIAKDANDRLVTVNNVVIPGIQRFSRVSVVPTTGDFTIVWDGVGPATVDFNGDPVLEETIGTGGGVFGQRFLSNGTQVGGLFRVNTTVPGPQRLSGVAVRAHEDSSPANHSIIVAWSGNGAQPNNIDAQGVFFQRYARQTPDVSFTLPGPNPVNYSTVTVSPLILDRQATLTAPTGFDYAGLRLTVVLSTTGTGANALNPALESLGIFDQGPGVDTVDINAANIIYNNVTIGTFAFAADPNDATKLQLVITFNASATTAAVQAVMRNVFYFNTLPPTNPLLTDRTATWFFVDAANLTTDLLTKTIKFTGQNNGGGGGSRFRNRGFCTDCGIPSQQYATTLYNVLLERPGTSQEIAALSAALKNGYPPQNAVAGFLNSVEYRRWLIADPTNGFYNRYLGRAADEGGVQFWLNAMAHGVSEQQVIAGIMGSAEFFTTQGGGTAAGFVNALYDRLLDRTASAGEVNYHVARLNAGTPRADVVYGFTYSTEFNAIMVREWYDHYLAQSTIDNRKLNNALAQFGSNNSWKAVQTYILTSLEAIPRPLILGS